MSQDGSACGDLVCVVLSEEEIRRARLRVMARAYDEVTTAILDVSAQAKNLHGSGGHITAAHVLPMVNAIRNMFTLCGVSREDVDEQILAAVEHGARPGNNTK